MINETVRFLTDEVNKFLSLKLGVTTDARLVPGNVARAMDADGGGSSNAMYQKAVISVVNIEEDRLSRPQEPFVRTDTGITYKQQPVYLNLYILFAVNLKEYPEALKWLAFIIQFFQQQNVFTPVSNPALDPRIQKLIADMCTLNFEQINHLWSTLGGKYLPSVMYKFRLVAIDEDLPVATSGFITEISFDNRSKQPVS